MAVSGTNLQPLIRVTMDKLFFVDVETTGTDHTKHGLIQVSGTIEINGEEKEDFNVRIQPFPDDEIDEEALAVTGTSMEGLTDYMDPGEAYDKIIKLLDKYIDKYDKKDKFQMIGYNVRFDEDFIRAFFRKNGDVYFGSWFHWPSIDITNIIAYWYMGSRSKFKNYKLMTVAKKLGMKVDEERAHDAMYDIEITKKLYHGMSRLIRGKKVKSA